MDLFLDTSVMLSACASAKGASRFIIEEAKARDWQLISVLYCREETRRNLHKLGGQAEHSSLLTTHCCAATCSFQSEFPIPSIQSENPNLPSPTTPASTNCASCD